MKLTMSDAVKTLALVSIAKPAQAAPAQALASRQYYDDGPASSGGCIRDTWYNDLSHTIIPFTDNLTGKNMYFSTQWKLNYPGDVKAALLKNNYRVDTVSAGPDSVENCGYGFQQNIGNPGRGTYKGGLFVRTLGDNIPYNETTTQRAAEVIGGVSNAVPLALAAASPAILVVGIVVLYSACVGLCGVASCIAKASAPAPAPRSRRHGQSRQDTYDLPPYPGSPRANTYASRW